MNQDVFQSKWKEIRGAVKEWWGKISEDELVTLGGRADKLIGQLHLKYGYNREKAAEEIERQVREAEMTGEGIETGE